MAITFWMPNKSIRNRRTNTGEITTVTTEQNTGNDDIFTLRPVPARNVRHSQMCPRLDVSDKNDQKMQDLSDKARFVRQ